VDVPEYCREIEAYLCRKNDGHLIRVVGPSFDRVSSWAERGVPIKVAFEGIDRYFERYYRAGSRRRPVKIDFCEADVLDVFDEWRRATGLTLVTPASTATLETEGSADASGSGAAREPARQKSLPDHLQRVLSRLSSARASGALDERFDILIDRIAAELDQVRAKRGGVRGQARAALASRLADIDRELVSGIRDRLEERELRQLRLDADEELAPFRMVMNASAYDRARDVAVERLMRARYNLPTIAFS
jgi:hypothetical protein